MGAAKGSLALIAGLMLASCAKEPLRPACAPDTFGYVESILNRSVVESAAEKANAILSGTDVVAWASWRDRPAAKRPVPIFIIDDESLPEATVAFAPNRQECLFITKRFVARFVELFGRDGVGTFDVEPDDALAIVLLHELGHFHNGDAGSYSAPTEISADGLPVALSNEKNAELRADRFAGEQLGAASTAADSRILAATPLIIALSHITWNREKIRLVDNLGATELGLSTVVGDAGYSHPNLELRFLIISYVSAPDALKPQALELVATLLDSRKRSAHPLWKASD